MVFRGLEASAIGEKKKRYAVGPSDGKTNGLPRKKRQHSEQPDGSEAVDAHIDSPHNARREVLQEPFQSHMCKEHADVLKAPVLGSCLVPLIWLIQLVRKGH
jgi:hypothetical protein